MHKKRGATRTPNWTSRIIRLHLISHLVLRRVVRLVQITAKSQIVLKHVAPPVESFISVFRPKTQLSQLCCANIANVAKQSSVMFINIKCGSDKLNFKFWVISLTEQSFPYPTGRSRRVRHHKETTTESIKPCLSVCPCENILPRDYKS